MDATDIRIILALQKDGRATCYSIAETIGVDEGTVRRRVKKMLLEGLIHIVVLESKKRSLEVLFSLQVDLDKIDHIAETVDAFEEVHWTVVVMGSTGIFAWASVSTQDKFACLEKRIKAVSGVRRVEASPLLIKKHRFNPVVR